MDLIKSKGFTNQSDVSKDRLARCLPQLRKQISFFRAYPDLFVDYIKGPDCTFKFYFYQRIFIRIVMRHRYVYATFPRAFSKSFLSMMVLMLRCILYPGSHLFVTTGGKEQAASITVAKVEEICKLIPAIHRELNWSRGKDGTKISKDNVDIRFKNGSVIDVLAASQRSRGQRRTGGLIEECILVDGDILNEVIIPTTNVDRRLADGSTDPKETVNKSQIYITTAGWKDSFAFAKLIETLVLSIVDPDEAMIIGGTYETPILEGLLNEDFVDQLKLNGSFSEDSFDREYRSIWSGDVENAFFSSEKIDKHRVLKVAEEERSGRASKNAWYMLGIDVGRIGCTTEVAVLKVTPQAQGAPIKNLVNFYTFEAEHFEQQAINIKKLWYQYGCEKICIDANGLGVGLVDFLVISQTDPETGDFLPPFGVENDDDNLYKKFIDEETVRDALYLVKANAPINTEAYTYLRTQIDSGKLQMLIDQQQARLKLLETKVGQAMTPDQRNDYLRPYTLTDSLRAQMLNLVENNDGVNIILKQASRSILKDKFSALLYGMYYCKKAEELKKKKKRVRLADLLCYTKM